MHFHDELKRIGSPSALQGTPETETPARKPLVERMSAPRPVRSSDHEAVSSENGSQAARETRMPPFLLAVSGNDNGGSTGGKASSEEGDVPPPLPAAAAKDTIAAKPPVPRRPRLLERISGLDKR
jgi:hypothetical protein